MTDMKAPLRLLLAILILSQLTACAALIVGGVAATSLAVHDRRSVGTVIDDNILKVRVRDALFRREEFGDDVRIKVDAFNGWVLLAGEVVDNRRIELAGQVAAEVPGVDRLFNELSALPRSGPGRANADRWLSTRVNGSLTRIRDLPGFDPTRVKVTTARGIVYLMGELTPEEAEIVIAHTRTVRGVERVVTLLQLPEPAGN